MKTLTCPLAELLADSIRLPKGLIGQAPSLNLNDATPVVAALLRVADDIDYPVPGGISGVHSLIPDSGSLLEEPEIDNIFLLSLVERQNEDGADEVVAHEDDYKPSRLEVAVFGALLALSPCDVYPLARKDLYLVAAREGEAA